MKISELVAEIKFDFDEQKLTDFSLILDNIKKVVEQIASGLQKISNEASSVGTSINSIKEKETSEDNNQKAPKNENNSLTGSIKASIKSFKASIAYFTFAIKLFGKIVNSVKPSIERAFQYQNFGYVTGLDTDKLSVLQNMIQRGGTGLTGEQVAKDIANMQQSLLAIRFGQGNIAPYKMLGLSAYYRDPFEVLEDLRESIKHLDNATASYFMKQIGLSHPDWIRFLREEIQTRPWDEYTKPTSGEREDTANLGRSAKRLKTAFLDLADRIVAFASGPLSLIMDVLSQIIDLLNMCLYPLKYISYALGSLHGMIDVAGIWIGEAVAKVVQAFDEIVKWFKDKLNISDAIAEKYGIMYDWGKDMVEGLVDRLLPISGLGDFSQTNHIYVPKVEDAPRVVADLARNNMRDFGNGNTYVAGYMPRFG